MQTWLLHIIYGTFTGNATHFDKAKKMLRWVVDVRHPLLLSQGVLERGLIPSNRQLATWAFYDKTFLHQQQDSTMGKSKRFRITG